MPGRQFNSDSYRYGFNGKENDNEVKGITGSQQDYGMRIYDPRLGRFLSVDPLTKSYPLLTPYQFASNDPIESIDKDGTERYDYRWVKDDKGNNTLQLMSKTDIVELVVNGYKSGSSFGNDAPVPKYETKINARQEYVVHTEYEEYIDNQGGLNMDQPQHKEVFDVRTFYKSYSDAKAGKNGTESLADRMAISSAINKGAMGPENAGYPALGLGNMRRTVVAGVEQTMTRVGQWMSAEEFEAFSKNGTIPRTNVLTKGAEGYEKQANVGDIYAEFDIDAQLLVEKDVAKGWSLIKSKNPSYLKLAEQKGVSLSDPIGTNIEKIKTKEN